MQECYLTSDNYQLWDWMLKHGNPNNHPFDYILGNVAVYKIKDAGYLYFSWLSDSDMLIHASLIKRIARGRWIDAANIAYYLGAERLVIGDTDNETVLKIAKHFKFYEENGMLYLDLPYQEKSK